MITRLTVAIAITIVSLSQASAAFDPDRIVTGVDHATKTVSCHAKRGEPSYSYKTTDKTVIRISGKRPLRSRGEFSQIKAGEVITVEYHLHGHDRVADRIVIHPR